MTHFGSYPWTSIFVWNLIYLEIVVTFLHTVLLLHCTNSAGCEVALLSKPEAGLTIAGGDCSTNGSPGTVCPDALVQHHSIVAWAPLPLSEGLRWIHAGRGICPVLIAISIVSRTKKNIQIFNRQMCITHPVSWRGLAHMQFQSLSKLHAHRPVQLCFHPFSTLYLATVQRLHDKEIWGRPFCAR